MIPLVGLVLCLFPQACGRRRLSAGEVERNRIFAEILQREDLRVLGGDGFFEKNLETSPYPEVREWSAMALGRIGNPRALPCLYRACKSSYAAVRAAAAFAVGEIEDRELLRLEGRGADARASIELCGMLADPSLQVQMRAVEALGKAGSGKEAGRIAALVDSRRFAGAPLQLRYLSLAITALMRLKDPAAYPALLHLALGSDPQIQWRAANALIRMGCPSAGPVFLQLIKSPHADVRTYGVRGLGMLRNPGLTDILTPLLFPRDGLTGKPVPLSVRVSALQSLAKLKSLDAIPAIAAALQGAAARENDPDEINFAIQAADTLGILGAGEAEATLAPLLQLKGPVSHAAVVALAKLSGQDRKRFFALAARDPTASPAATRAWAQALGELGGDRAIQELKIMLVRAAAADASRADILAVPATLTALAKTDAPDLDEILESYLTSHDGVVLRAAAAAYRPKAGVPAPWAPIVRAYRAIAESHDVETKVALLDRLEPWSRLQEVQNFLREALRDGQRNARIAAARLLRMSGSSDVPLEPGRSESTWTPAIRLLAAGSRQDRSVAIVETDRGTIEIELFRQEAPLTVANFASLARQGYFDGLSFMRVVPYFVIQGGDPRNDQEGGPGYAIRCEINMHPFERGSVGMALAGKDTGGSQFFITLSPQPHLDGGYTCFGRVIAGMQVVDRMIPGDRIRRIRVVEDITALDYRRF